MIQINTFRNQKGDSRHQINSEYYTRIYFKNNLYPIKFEPKDMEKFTDSSKPAQLKQEEMNNLNTTSEESKIVI